MCSRCFVGRCQTELLAVASTASPTASPKSFAKRASSIHLENGQRLAGNVSKSETIANTDEGEKIPPFAPRKMAHPARPLYLKALWRSRGSELPRKFRSLLQWTIHKRSEQTRVPKGSAVGNARDRGHNHEMVIQTEQQRSGHREGQENEAQPLLGGPNESHGDQGEEQHDQDDECHVRPNEANTQFQVGKTMRNTE